MIKLILNKLSKNDKKIFWFGLIYIFSILLVMLSLIYYFGFFEYLNPKNLKFLARDLLEIIQKYYFTSIIIFSIFIILWVLVGGIMSPVILVGGYLFGPVISTFIITLFNCIAATFFFLLMKLFFKPIVDIVLNIKFKKIINFINKNCLYFFFIFRLFGGFGAPSPIQNIIPIATKINTIQFFYISFFGTAPLIYIWSNIGYSLKIISDYDKINFNIFSDFQILFTLFLIALLPILSKFSKQILK